MPLPSLLSIRSRLIIVFSLTFIISACGVPDQPSGQNDSFIPTVDEVHTSTPTLTLTSTDPTVLSSYPPPAPTIKSTPVSAVSTCTYPLPGTKTNGTSSTALSIDKFRFSEPKVVFEGETVTISDWHPDGKRLLITRREGNSERIEIFTPSTQMVELITTRINEDGKPYWIDNGRQIVYSDIKAPSSYVLRTVRTDLSEKPRDVVELSLPYISVSRKGNSVVARNNDRLGQPIKYIMQGNVLSREEQRVALPPTKDITNEAKEPNTPFNYTWSADETRIFVANDQVLYSTNNAFQNPCVISLGVSSEGKSFWAYRVTPSPDGNYLAIGLATGYPPQTLDHFVLDLRTGVIDQIKTEASQINEVSWSSDSRYLIGMGVVNVDATTRVPYLGLFIVDVQTGESRRLFPEFTTLMGGGFGYAGGRISWSPDSKAIFVQCISTDALISQSYKEALCEIGVNT